MSEIKAFKEMTDLAVNSIKNQVGIVVTDLRVLHGANHVSVPDELAFEELLRKATDQSLRL